MTIRILTSGAIGFEELRTTLNQQYTEYSLDQLHQAVMDVSWDPKQPVIKVAYPFLITIKPEFTRDDLKSATDDSEQLQRYLHLLEKALPIFAADDQDHIVLGREHGLGFVPMITVQREQIRRETKLMSAIVPHASSYHISFAGDSRLTVFLKD